MFILTRRVNNWFVGGRHDGAECDAKGDHDDREVLGSGISLVKKDDTHDHVGNQGSGSEDHVQWHRDVEIECVVVCYTDEKVECHHNDPCLEGYFRGNGAELCGEDEALNGEEKELRKSDEVSNSRILLDEKFEKDDVATAAHDHHRHSELSL